MHRRDTSRRSQLQPGPHRLDVLVIGDLDGGVAEVPARLLAQDAGRLAASSQFDDAARNLQVAGRAGERRRVAAPEPVPVRGEQGDRPEPTTSSSASGRLDGRRPVRRSASHVLAAAAWGERHALAHARERLVQGKRVLEPDLVLGDGPGRKVHVRQVAEAGDDAAPAQVDSLRLRQRRLVRPDATGDQVAGDRERAHDRKGRLERADDAVLEDHVDRDSYDGG